MYPEIPDSGVSSDTPKFPEHSKAWLDQLAGEYRIIQDKIDKIAGFRFTIRGWSVTLVVAFAFGANTLKLPPYWILSAFVPLAAFMLMERSQERYGDILAQWAIRIEKRIWRILRLSSPEKSEMAIGGMVPRLAHDLGEANRLVRPVLHGLSSRGYLLFYGIQMALVLTAAAWLSGYQQHAASRDEGPAPVIINNMNVPEPPGQKSEVPDSQQTTPGRH